MESGIYSAVQLSIGYSSVSSQVVQTHLWPSTEMYSKLERGPISDTGRIQYNHSFEAISLVYITPTRLTSVYKLSFILLPWWRTVLPSSIAFSTVPVLCAVGRSQALLALRCPTRAIHKAYPGVPSR